jgi:isopentenyl-diphosphate delta-isomerase
MKKYDPVITVDVHDRPLGELDKMTAHRTPVLHRAVSVFLFNHENQVLIQKRAANKYHSANLWANAACTHPRPGETCESTAIRRLEEEIGAEADLTFFKKEIYFANSPPLMEFELVHIFKGMIKSDVVPNKNEVSDVKWVTAESLTRALHENPEDFAPWLRIYGGLFGRDLLALSD